MKIKRAMEILDPTHRERYDSLGIVEDACRMGITALKRNLPHMADIVADEDLLQISCPECGADLLEYIEAASDGYDGVVYCPICGVHIVYDKETEQEELNYE